MLLCWGMTGTTVGTTVLLLTPMVAIIAQHRLLLSSWLTWREPLHGYSRARHRGCCSGLTSGRAQSASHDPGEAATKAGHLQALGWLLHRCPGLAWPRGVLVGAARYSDLATPQVTAVWKGLLRQRQRRR